MSLNRVLYWSKLLVVGRSADRWKTCKWVNTSLVLYFNQFSFPKCFHWIQPIQWQKNIYHNSKRLQTCNLLCEKPGCYHSASKTHVRDRILKLIPMHTWLTYPWIRWIHRSPVPFRENSNRKVWDLFASLGSCCLLGYPFRECQIRLDLNWF